jgi:hypothetical protein
MRKLLFLLFFLPAAAFAQLPSITTATVVKLQKGDVTWLCRLDSLAAFLSTTDNNGIYSGSGTIPPNTTAKVSLNNAFEITYNNTTTGFVVSDETGGVSWQSKYNAHSINIDTSLVSIYAPILLIAGTGNDTIELRIEEPIGSNFTSFRAQAQSADIYYTLPAAAGTDGQQLTWNTGGILTWDTAGIIGNGTSGQVTYWNGTTTVTGGTNFTFNGTNVGIGGAVNSDHQLYMHGTSAIRIPVGNTAQRPTTPVAGALRLNLDGEILEYYDGSDWQSTSGGGGSGESNTASNVGSGAGWYKQKTGVDLEFKTIVAGGGISVANNTSDLTVSTTAPQPASSETIEASNFTATMRRINLVDCSAGTITVTPPSSPAIGDRFAVVDAEATAATNNITIDFDTANQKLYAIEQNYIINVAGGYVEFIYMGTTTGWVATKG